MDTGDRLLTPGEVAALFRVDPKTVTRSVLPAATAASASLKCARCSKAKAWPLSRTTCPRRPISRPIKRTATAPTDALAGRRFCPSVVPPVA